MKKKSKLFLSEKIEEKLKPTLSLLPNTDGIISLTTANHSEKSNKRVIELLSSLGNCLKKVNQEYLNSEEFEFILNSCIKGVRENYQKTKLVAFKALLINSTLDFETTQNEKEYYLELLNSLNELHIKILTLMISPENYLSYYNIDLTSINDKYISETNHQDINFKNLIPELIPGYNFEIIKAAFLELSDLRLIWIKNKVLEQGNLDTLFTFPNRVKDNGLKFINFISLENSNIQTAIIK
ncbi:hypothetical protein [Olleya sp. YS]|uniref:hypothetical protein n=1 Tax=Olleya sp. YS TaxID=3028318 RepID=UPI002434327D|nr:hypothetical protein [Olleya sp. YS]WGD34011.1 hypothetical protein Ollyesu_09485 [Olleya sp. YS]